MSVFERFVSKRHRDGHDIATRATCLRCRREYTPEPDGQGADEYCWWCAARISQTQIAVVTE
jgi:hypothetical protein